jgi:hypothetical protein
MKASPATLPLLLSVKFLNHLREHMRYLRFSLETDLTYVH